MEESMKLTRGQYLTHEQRNMVKATFVYRWTHENRHADAVYAKLGAPTMPKESDEDWIIGHAFYIRKDGQLAKRPGYAEPVYLASEE
jgi:hypothetical protein